ncbi:MAG: hypothetical protein QM608_21830 [Caulobacter sp.]
MVTTVGADISAREVLVRVPTSFVQGAPAPPHIGDLALAIAALGDLFNWVNGERREPDLDRANAETRFSLREAKPGSLELFFEVIRCVNGTIIAPMAGQLPTAIANFMSCLQLAKSVKFLPHDTFYGNKKYEDDGLTADDLVKILIALKSGTSRVGKIEVATKNGSITISDIDFQ